MKVRMTKPEKLKGGLLLIGFPSRGLVGGIAAGYLIEQLSMWPIGEVWDQRLPPTIVVRDGYAYSPIQLYASAERCGPDGKCEKLVVCLGEIPLEPAVLGEFATEVLRWAKDEGISHVVVLEGIEKPDGAVKKGAQSAVYAVRSRTSKHPLAKYEVEPVKKGVISSHASAFLAAANEAEMDVLALFTAGRAEFPDARAAALLLRKVDPMLPNIDLRPKKLERTAAKMETEIRASLTQNAKQVAALQRPLDMMYR